MENNRKYFSVNMHVRFCAVPVAVGEKSLTLWSRERQTHNSAKDKVKVGGMTCRDLQ